MRSLFATILAITTSVSAVPAIATSMGKLSTSSPISISQASTNLSASPNPQNLKVSTFAQRSLNLAKQIPQDVIGLLVVDVDQGSWNVLEQFQVPPQSPIVAIDKLLAFLGKSSQISLNKDIQPWAGTELAIAVFGGNDKESAFNFAALSVITDNQQFENFIKKLNGLDLPKPTKTLYQGIEVLEWQLQKDESDTEETEEAANPQVPDLEFKRFFIAKLPSGFAAIASDLPAMQKLIDFAVVNPEAPSPSLADNQLFRRSLNNPLWNRSLIAGYGSIQGIEKVYELLAADLPETSDIPGFTRAEYLQGLKYTLGQYSSFDLFTWVTPKGLRSQSNSYFSAVRSPQPKDTESRDRLLSFLPLNVYGAITSRNLNRQWQWLVEESKLQPSYKIFVEGLRMLGPLIVGSGLDLDIEKDVIPWIDGEYALVVFPSDRSPFKEMGVDLTMGALVRTSKPDAANAALAKLTKYLSNFDKDFIQVKKRQVGNTLLTSFEFPDPSERGKTQSVFAYGWRDRQTLLLTLGANTASAFIPVPKPALMESDDFRDAIADMPQPNFGYFYLNANAIAKQVAQLIFTTDLMSNPEQSSSDDQKNDKKTEKPKVPEPILKAINKLGGAVFVYSETSDRLQSDFFLGLKP